MKRLWGFYKNLLAENREWVRKVLIWFFLAFLSGIAVFYYEPGLLTKILEVFEEKFGVEPALDFNLVLKIFLQNLIASAIALLGGVVLGITAFLIATFNGFILGYILAALFGLSDGSFLDNLLFISFGLVPHAILELPAFILAGALGLRLGIEWIGQSAQGNRMLVLKRDFKIALLASPAIAFALFMAALIEVYVSGNLVK